MLVYADYFWINLTCFVYYENVALQLMLVNTSMLAYHAKNRQAKHNI